MPYRRLPVWLGNTLEIFGLFFGLFLILFYSQFPFPLQILVILVAWFCFWYFSHCFAHYVVGKAMGIKFKHYFVGKSSITKLNSPLNPIFKFFPVLGIKVDHETLKELSKNKKFVFYSSGALASMLTPTICLIPAWQMGKLIFGLMLLLTIGNVLLTLILSPRVGDLYRARKA